MRKLRLFILAVIARIVHISLSSMACSSRSWPVQCLLTGNYTFSCNWIIDTCTIIRSLNSCITYCFHRQLHNWATVMLQIRG